MIIIKDIEFLEVDGDKYEILSKNPSDPIETVDGKWVDGILVRELIKGVRFRRPRDNIDIVVGTSKQAADIIGIQYECWQNLEMELNNLRVISANYKVKINNLSNELNDIKSSTFLKRLNQLFFGYQ